VLLLAAGTVFVFSASASVVREINLAQFYRDVGLRRLVLFPVAIAVLYLFGRFDYRYLSLQRGWSKSVAVYLLALSVILLLVVLLPWLGTEVNSARRWLRMSIAGGDISFQPSELAKWSLMFFLAAYLARYADSLYLYRRRFLPVCLVVGLIAGLIILEDFGTAVFVVLLAFLMLLIGGVRWRHLLTPLPFAGAAFAAVVISSPSRLNRIQAFLNPQEWSGTTAYQANQSLIALGSGGLWGKGLGCGISKYGHLPEDTTDFIFAVIGEELGFVGTAGVILLFVIFIWLGILTVARCRDDFGRLLAAAIVMCIGIQAVINIGVVTVMLPTKGIPLPFVSAGGTSMLLTSAAAGILMNVARVSCSGGEEGQSP